MAKIYFTKSQNTNDKSITRFYYNKSDKNYNNLDFLIDKIAKLIASDKTTDNAKKQLQKLRNFDFAKYDCFYIYSNQLCFGIDKNTKTIDFYNNDYDSIINLQDYAKNYNCKYASAHTSDCDKIDSSDL